MQASRTSSLLTTLCALLALTAATLAAVTLLPAGPRGAALACLCTAKAGLVVFGFMRIQHESRMLAGFLIGYAAILCGLAGLRIALIG